MQPGLGSQASRRLIPELSNISNMVQFDPRNRSTYHAGILKVQRRFSQGMQFLSSYTWSKSLDYGGSAASGGGQTGGPQTVTNLNAGHGTVRASTCGTASSSAASTSCRSARASRCWTKASWA